MPPLLPQLAPRHEAKCQSSHLNPLCCTTVRFGSKNRPQRCRKMPPTRRWRASGRFFAYFGASPDAMLIRQIENFDLVRSVRLSP